MPIQEPSVGARRSKDGNSLATLVLEVPETVSGGLGYRDRLEEWRRWCTDTAGLGPEWVDCGSAEHVYLSPQRDHWESTEERLQRLRNVLERPLDWQAYQVEEAVRTLCGDPVSVGAASPRRVFRVDTLARLRAGETHDGLLDRKRRMCFMPETTFIEVCTKAHMTVRTVLGFCG